MNLSLKPSYIEKNIKISSGFDLSLMNPQNKILNAWNIESDIAFQVKEKDFGFRSGLWYCPFSEWIREYNIVLAFRYEGEHWDITIGNNSRIYSLTSKACELLPDSSENTSAKEWRNLMYHFEFLLKPRDYKWNVSGGITDFAPFFFHQETNPMLFAGLKYRKTDKITLFSRFWYQPAGSFNLQADYFGFFIQGGAIWTAGK